MQHCYDRFIIYNTDSKSTSCYSTVDSTLISTKTQPTYKLIKRVFWKQEAELLPRDHSWLRGTVVERPSMTGKLSMFYA